MGLRVTQDAAHRNLNPASGLSGLSSDSDSDSDSGGRTAVGTSRRLAPPWIVNHWRGHHKSTAEHGPRALGEGEHGGWEYAAAY